MDLDTVCCCRNRRQKEVTQLLRPNGPYNRLNDS